MTEERLASIKYHELSSHLVHPESGYADTLTKEQLAVSRNPVVPAHGAALAPQAPPAAPSWELDSISPDGAGAR